MIAALPCPVLDVRLIPLGGLGRDEVGEWARADQLENWRVSREGPMR
jgi:hypothetical protein